MVFNFNSHTMSQVQRKIPAAKDRWKLKCKLKHEIQAWDSTNDISKWTKTFDTC